jgi:hypothetical protein
MCVHPWLSGGTQGRSRVASEGQEGVPPMVDLEMSPQFMLERCAQEGMEPDIIALLLKQVRPSGGSTSPYC